MPREAHPSARLGQVCPSCGETIPGHGYYTTEEFSRYFAGPTPPERPSAMTAEESELWVRHGQLRLAYEDAVFKVEDFRRGQMGARGDDAAAGARGVSFEALIAEGRECAEKIRKEDEELLLVIQKLGAIRGRNAYNALLAENTPTAALTPGLAERVVAALRGR